MDFFIVTTDEATKTLKKFVHGNSIKRKKNEKLEWVYSVFTERKRDTSRWPRHRSRIQPAPPPLYPLLAPKSLFARRTLLYTILAHKQNWQVVSAPRLYAYLAYVCVCIIYLWERERELAPAKFHCTRDLGDTRCAAVELFKIAFEFMGVYLTIFFFFFSFTLTTESIYTIFLVTQRHFTIASPVDTTQAVGQTLSRARKRRRRIEELRKHIAYIYIYTCIAYIYTYIPIPRAARNYAPTDDDYYCCCCYYSTL